MESIIAAIEQYCRQHDIEHRFVGGVAYAGLLTPKTTYDIDIDNRTIALRNHTKLSSVRDDGTTRDIDIIIFTPSKKKITDLKRFVRSLKPRNDTRDTFPHISIEATIYPSFGKPQTIFQFVTSLIADTDGRFGTGQLYLAFDTIRQAISWKSLEAWQITLQNGLTYTVRHPYADYLAYHFRMPSGIKPKDEAKVKYLKALADRTIALGRAKKIDYLSPHYYGAWEEYIRRLTNAGGWVKMKASATKLYWSTIGTDIAHGKGPLSKLFLGFSNQFTGIHQ